MGHRRYRAFLSYSHRDRRTAAWLHRALETFLIPRHLVGTTTSAGEVPRTLAPVFKDREDLPAAGCLADVIDSALANSDALIVICSPAARQSPWVDKEVERFKQIHGDRRIFALVVNGEAADCFPPTLTIGYRDGVPSGQPAEPIAADLTLDGRRHALLKLVAGLTGLDLDDLVRRDHLRRQRRLALVTAASLAGMVGTSSLAIYALEQRDEARAQRAEADGLIEYMLTDLRGRLEPVGQLDVLKSVGDRALEYYARQNLDHLDGDSLGQRARAMLLVAEVGDLQGDTAAARRGFAEAARSTAELLRREPDNWQRVFDHAQSEFWLAYAAHNRGEYKEALPHFIAYRDLARRLTELAPAKRESQVELASAEVNLGVALVANQQARDALASFERAADRFAAIRPQSRDILLNHNQALGHKASALYALGDNDGALATRRRQLAMLSQAPLAAGDREAQDARAVVLAQTGIAHLAGGDLGRANRALRDAEAGWRELVAIDPANNLWRGEYNAVRMWRAVAASRRDRAAAAAEIAEILRDQRALVGESPDWAHKVNLLRMIAFDRALGGGASRADEPILREAWLRRNSLKADERAVLAAVLISEGDRIAGRDGERARLLWREASNLLPAGEAATWSLAQRARLQRRIGERVTLPVRVSANAFAGSFAEGPPHIGSSS